MLNVTAFLIARSGLHRIARACAINQNAFLAERLADFRKTSINLIVGRHINLGKSAADFFGHRFAFFLIQVENTAFHAFFSEQAHSGFTQSGGATGNNGGNI